MFCCIWVFYKPFFLVSFPHTKQTSAVLGIPHLAFLKDECLQREMPFCILKLFSLSLTVSPPPSLAIKSYFMSFCSVFDLTVLDLLWVRFFTTISLLYVRRPNFVSNLSSACFIPASYSNLFCSLCQCVCLNAIHRVTYPVCRCSHLWPRVIALFSPIVISYIHIKYLCCVMCRKQAPCVLRMPLGWGFKEAFQVGFLRVRRSKPLFLSVPRGAVVSEVFAMKAGWWKLWNYQACPRFSGVLLYKSGICGCPEKGSWIFLHFGEVVGALCRWSECSWAPAWLGGLAEGPTLDNVPR